MDAAYAEAYPELYRKHWWWRARERVLLRILDALICDGTGRLRILDVGCGAGLFFGALQRFGSVEGLESDARAIAQSGEWRDSIHQGNLDDSFRPSHPYDLVLMLDVLEHVDDPDDLLGRVRGLLAPGGRVLITVPAFQWLWTRHDDINHHLRRYTLGQLTSSVAAAGLRAFESRFLFQSLMLSKLGVRIAERLMSPKPAVPWIPPPKVNRMIQSWFEFEFRIAGRIPVGSSILMVAELPPESTSPEQA